MKSMLSLSNEVTQLVYCVLRNSSRCSLPPPTLSLPRLAQDVIVLIMFFSIIRSIRGHLLPRVALRFARWAVNDATVLNLYGVVRTAVTPPMHFGDIVNLVALCLYISREVEEDAAACRASHRR